MRILTKEDKSGLKTFPISYNGALQARALAAFIIIIKYNNGAKWSEDKGGKERSKSLPDNGGGGLCLVLSVSTSAEKYSIAAYKQLVMLLRYFSSLHSFFFLCWCCCSSCLNVGATSCCARPTASTIRAWIFFVKLKIFFPFFALDASVFSFSSFHLSKFHAPHVVAV